MKKKCNERKEEKPEVEATNFECLINDSSLMKITFKGFPLDRVKSELESINKLHLAVILPIA